MSPFQPAFAALLLSLSLLSPVSAHLFSHRKGANRQTTPHNAMLATTASDFFYELHLNAKRASSSSNTWSALGCVSEGSSGRTLAAYSQKGLSSLTIETCLNVCASMAYLYAGVEYGAECYCADSLSNGGGVAVSQYSCNMPCSGNSAEKCGGNNVLQLYESTDTCAASASVSATTTSAPSTSTTATSTSAAASSTASGTITSGSTTWSSLGCVKDSPRMLSGSYQELSNNSPATCIATCVSQGYIYAGLEYYNQCWCSNSLLSTITTGTCNDICPGDSSAKCGDIYMMNLYKQTGGTALITSGTSTWKSLGCVSDSPRMLSGTYQELANNSPATCLATCNAQGYAYAGLEYYNQCWCANSLLNSITTGTCNDICPGDANSKCGDIYMMNLYQRTSAGTTTASTATSTTTSSTTTSAAASATATTLTVGSGTWQNLGCVSDSPRMLSGSYQEFTKNSPATCLAACQAQGYSYAGLEYYNQCWCANTLLHSITSATCNDVCPGDSTAKCGDIYVMNLYHLISSTATSTSSSAVSTATATITSGATTWSAVGCVSDSPRMLTGSYQELSNNSPANCIAVCVSQGFTYAGLEYYNECYCGSSLVNSVTAATGQCGAICPGNSSTTCGDSYKMNLYNQTSTSLITSGSSKWKSLGCVSDSPRMLTGSSQDITSNSPAKCIATCLSQGYTYAGMEYGTQCWCGSALANTLTAATGQCSYSCPGDSSSKCGDAYKLNLYQRSS